MFEEVRDLRMFICFIVGVNSFFVYYEFDILCGNQFGISMFFIVCNVDVVERSYLVYDIGILSLLDLDFIV